MDKIYFNNGVLISREKCQIKQDAKTKHNILIFPNKDIQELAENLFRLDKQIQEVTIPNTVKKIGTGCFKNCQNLQLITIPNNVIELGKYCFSACSKLKHVKLSKQLNKIPESCFNSCSSLEEIVIPDNITTLEENCFSSCLKLKKIQLPLNLSKIEEGVFENCTSLESIVLNENIISISDRLFFNCRHLKDLRLSSKITHIGNMSFSGCKNLNDIEFPETLNCIGEYSFEDCIGLTNVIIPNNVQKIDYGAFENCCNIENLIIHSNKVQIQDNAFGGCSNIKNLNVPKGVLNNTIFDFFNMPNLKNIIYDNRKLLELQPNDKFENLINNGKFIYLEYTNSEGNTIYKIVEDKLNKNQSQYSHSENLTKDFTKLLNHKVFNDLYKNSSDKVDICLNMMSMLNINTCIKFLDKLLDEQEAEKIKIETLKIEKSQHKKGFINKIINKIKLNIFKRKNNDNFVDNTAYTGIQTTEKIEVLFKKPEILSNVSEYNNFFETNLDEITKLKNIQDLRKLLQIQKNFHHFMQDGFLKRKCIAGNLTLLEAFKFKQLYNSEKRSDEDKKIIDNSKIPFVKSNDMDFDERVR